MTVTTGRGHRERRIMQKRTTVQAKETRITCQVGQTAQVQDKFRAVPVTVHLQDFAKRRVTVAVTQENS